jgi:hypothetical protein
MITSQLANTLSYIAGIVTFICTILNFIGQALDPGPHQKVAKIFIKIVAFPAGAFVAWLILNGFSLITPAHPFGCVTNGSLCGSTSSFYSLLLKIAFFTFMFGGGGLSTLSIWKLIK